MFLKIFFLCLLSVIFVADASQEFSVPLEFAIEDDEYQPFGQIDVKTSFDGSHSAGFSTSNEKINALKNLLSSSSPEKLYRIKANNGIFSTNTVGEFLRSNFAHLLELTVDFSSQTVLSLTNLPAKDVNASSQSSSPHFYTRVKAVSELPGPDTFSYLQRMEEEKRARQQGATQDNRSFLQKYWIYFVPVLFFVVLSNAFSTEQPAE